MGEEQTGQARDDGAVEVMLPADLDRSMLDVIVASVVRATLATCTESRRDIPMPCVIP